MARPGRTPLDPGRRHRRPRTRIAKLLAGVVGAGVLSAAGGLSALGVDGPAGGASASSSPTTDPSVSASYSCAVPVLGATTFSATLSGSAPASVGPGGQVSVSNYEISISFPASLVTDLISLGATSPLSGTVTEADVDASDASPATINAASTPIPLSVPLTSGQAATIQAQSASVGPFTASAPGTIDFTPGTITFSGMFPVIGQASIPCTLTTSPAPTFASTTVTQAVAPLSVATTSLSGATAGLAYSDTLEAAGGTPPYSWQLASGSTLPPGLVLDSSTGVISGIPTTPGSYQVAFTVTDSSTPKQSATSAALTIAVAPPVPIATPYLWGENGEPGNNLTTDNDVPTPVQLPPGTTVTAESAGEDFTLVLTSAGSVYAWGDNEDGQLGNGTTTDSSTPVQVDLPAGVSATAISAGGYQALALTSTGAVYAWGANYYGQLGNGTTINSDTPVAVQLPAGVTATAVAGGGAHSLALAKGGAVYAWGHNGNGQLGNGTTTDSDTPVAVQLPAGVTATAVGGGGAHSLALSTNGSVYAWGANGSGQLGNGTTTDSDTPVAVPLPAGVTATAVAGGGAHSLALSSDGSVYAWGNNAEGQLGDGGFGYAWHGKNWRVDSEQPVRTNLPRNADITAVAAGANHSLALSSTGAVYAWGANADGQLGDSSTTNRVVPVLAQLPAGSKATSIGAGPTAIASVAGVVSVTSSG